MPRLILRSLFLLVLSALVAPQAHAEEETPDDLSKVVGMDKFPGGAREHAHLARNGFVVLPRVHRQMFSLYIGGQLSYYITCDSAHRTYHVLFEATLEGLEKAYARTLAGFVQGLHTRLLEVPAGARGRTLALQHVAVAAALLGAQVAHPAGAAAGVAETVTLIEAAGGQGVCPLFGVKDDYALYLPRSLYTGSDALKRYFRAVMWMARRGFRVAHADETWAALHITQAIQGDEKLAAFHREMDAMLTWLVGPADDLTVAEYAAALPTGALDGAAFAKAQTQVQALRDPEINAAMLAPDAWRTFAAQTKGLRILPSRRTPDAWLFQQLNEAVPGHGSPEGLEVAAALGSSRAHALLSAQGNASAASAAHIQTLRKTFEARIDGTLYGQTLRAAQLLFQEDTPLHGQGTMPAPKVAVPQVPAAPLRTSAWKDRLLVSGLSGWASLRHAFALHAKNVAHMMSAAFGKTGVVEPAPEYFSALAGLARLVQQRCRAAGAFATPASRDQIRALLPLLDKVATGVMPDEDEVVGLIAFESALQVLMAAHGDANTLKRFALVAARLRAWLDEDKPLRPEELSALQGGAISELAQHWTDFAELMDGLQEIAQAQLRGAPLTEAQAQVIEGYGTRSGPLNLFYGNSYMAPQRQMGLVVDVGSDPRAGTYREVGVGGAMELYLVLPWSDGTRRLYRGAVYSYYEFDAQTPVTDEAWTQRIEARTVPSMPRWTESFAAKPDVEDILAALETGKQTDAVEDVHDERLGRAMLGRLRATTKADDKHAAWLAGHLARYGDGALRASIVDVLFDKLVKDDNGSFVHAAAWALKSLATPADRDRAVALLVAPPKGAHKDLRDRMALVLRRIGGEDLVPLLRRLASHETHSVRFLALRDLIDRVRWRDGEERNETAVLVAQRLATESRPEIQLLALESLKPLASSLPAEHAATILRYLDHENVEHRALAAKALGVMRAESAAPKLLKALDDTSSKVAKAAAEALGASLRGSQATDVQQRAVEALGARFATGNWGMRIACMEGMGSLGTAAAAAKLARIALNKDYETRLRGAAIRDLTTAGKVSLPYLYALCFDETPTGNSTNDHDERLCDDAIAALVEILERSDPAFIPHEGLGPDPTEAARQNALVARYREEARKLGHAPK